MLLQTYLRRHGDKSCRYHRCTAAKLLQHGFTLPVWLTAEYKVHALLDIVFLDKKIAYNLKTTGQIFV